jgi:murein DD-endopeptidase MepM/ murein hydrolase activator NlpD
LELAIDPVKRAQRKGLFDKRSDLPTIIIARGKDIRYFTVRPWAVAVTGTILSALAVGYLAATAYLVLRDDLITASIARQARLQQAYEDRISALRGQVDRITSRQLLEQQLMQRRMTELLQRQEELTERHSRLTPVLDRAEQLGSAGKGPVPTPRPEIRAGIDHEAITGSAYASVVEPPVPWPIRSASEAPREKAAANDLLLALDRSLQNLESDQLARISSLTEEAYQTTEAIGEALGAAGIPLATGYGEEDVGGPLIAPGEMVPFEDRVRELDEALDRLEEAKQTARRIPIANPLPGAAVTSGFGMRRDPLLGRPAHHSGLDFQAEPGAPVRAAGAGVIVTAGWQGGYGRLVEIDHGNGMTTRYAHLSKILVREGEEVANGAIVGRVGSSGRSTGPHLHYEVRKRGAAVNPLKFISVGRRIRELL